MIVLPAVPRLASALLLVASFAGCLGSTVSDTLESTPAGYAEFSETTGGIEGTVVDDSIVPIAGAHVGLQETAASMRTDEAGRFSFSYLAPGAYTVVVNAFNSDEMIQRVDVVVGAVATAQFVVPQASGTGPYTALATFEGFLECAFDLPGIGAGNCVPQSFFYTYSLPNPTNSKQIGLYRVESLEKAIQGIFEMTWNPSTATTSGELAMTIERAGTASAAFNNRVFGTAAGKSPVRFVANATMYQDAIEQHKEHVQTRIWANSRDPPAPQTIVLNQRFTVFLTTCYIQECPEGFSALPDS